MKGNIREVNNINQIVISYSNTLFISLGFYLKVEPTYECQNLPNEWSNRVSSINTNYNKCISLYTVENCKNESFRFRFYRDEHDRTVDSDIYPQLINQYDFTEAPENLNKNTKSYMLCNW